MLNSLAKNQFVKMTKKEDEFVEYGLVTSTDIGKDVYEILSIGCLNDNGEFLLYPIDVEEIKENISIRDRIFEDVKETKIRRKMNKWIEENLDKIKH